MEVRSAGEIKHRARRLSNEVEDRACSCRDPWRDSACGACSAQALGSRLVRPCRGVDLTGFFFCCVRHRLNEGQSSAGAGGGATTTV
eukprot:2378725-Prymnesium_polylepis.1